MSVANTNSSVTATERARRVHELLVAFGLQNQAETIVGTPIMKGISGGQKRRLSIASQLITVGPFEALSTLLRLSLDLLL